MKRSVLKILLLIVLLATAMVACSKQASHKQDEWWSTMTSPTNVVVKNLTLKRGESSELSVELNGVVRLGLLVREVESMRKSRDETGNASAIVFLEQQATSKRVGTYYSASDIFDLSLGRGFRVYNLSPVDTDIVIYRDPNP